MTDLFDGALPVEDSIKPCQKIFKEADVLPAERIVLFPDDKFFTDWCRVSLPCQFKIHPVGLQASFGENQQLTVYMQTMLFCNRPEYFAFFLWQNKAKPAVCLQ